MDQKLKLSIETQYQHHFHSAPAQFVIAPGRINLIGEHTDYSEGFVLPVAIDRHVAIAFSPRKDHLVKVYSGDFNEEIQMDLDEIEKSDTGWGEYIKGMAWALSESGYELTGWQGVVAGNIPIGAGLSSSAAFEIAVGKTFCLSSKIDLPPGKLAVISRKAEAEWVGVNVGIMDQLISAAGKTNHAVLLDCRTLDYEYVAIPEKIRMVVLDTMTRRELTHSEYNTRHDEVRQAAQILQVSYLRDATSTLLQERRANLTPKLYRRANHVVTENQRVLEFVNAMRNNQTERMGRILNESHVSLRDDFEVTNHELNLIVSLAQENTNCLGARMMGAGFGGCALALLAQHKTTPFINEVSTRYHAETGCQPHIFSVSSADGVSVA